MFIFAKTFYLSTHPKGFIYDAKTFLPHLNQTKYLKPFSPIQDLLDTTIFSISTLFISNGSLDLRNVCFSIILSCYKVLGLFSDVAVHMT